MKTCTMARCARKYKCKSLCNLHYRRRSRGAKLSGSSRLDKRPAIVKNDIAFIPLGVDAKDGYAIVDEEFSYLDKYLWTVTPAGYAFIPRKNILMHRLITEASKNKQVDHKNGNPKDNRLNNLRVCTDLENKWNSRKHKGTHTSKYKGVFWDYGKYRVRLSYNYKRIDVGRFDNEIKAAEAYDQKAKELYGEFAKLNFEVGT